ncbi:MAG: 4Fe-4S binding protein [Bacteroidales bacterium]|nr:4Fe-4S binding protein [Bacteroidales bacterium]MDD4821488.1 4Fe-4S binding protein [Bacteroidales bacterium]
MSKYLPLIRRIVASIVFAFFLFVFLDFTNSLNNLTGFFPKIQWIPALLSLSGVLIFLFALSLLFGRIYCSVLCPLGILQDIISYISRKIRGKKKSRLDYVEPSTIIRFSIMGVVLLTFVFGSSLVVLLLDPYSSFGRIASNLFRPLYILANNAIADLANSSGNFFFYKVEITTVNMLSVLTATGMFLIIGAFAWFRGRLYCNMICPVGSFLGLLSHFSLFKIRMNESRCTHCTLCEKKCKSQCIDSKNGFVDQTRCVTCFNCVSVCKSGGVSYQLSLPQKSPKVQKKEKKSIDNMERRRILASTGMMLLSIPLIRAEQLADTSKLTAINRQTPVAPPGAGSIKEFSGKCTACQLCITQCPSDVLKPATMHYGLEGIMQPTLIYTNGFCNFSCTLCTTICPTGALKPLTIEQKKTSQIGIAHFITENCVVYRDETDCGACSEHCPTQAVKMVDYKDGLRIPKVTPALCVGCGGCEYICPATPYKAIYVEGNSVHQKSEKIAEGKQDEPQVDDFGF